MNKTIKAIILTSVCILLTACNSNIPSEAFITELDALVDSTIGESETIYDKEADEIVITQTAFDGSAYAITHRKNDIKSSWNDFLTAYRLLSEVTYDGLQEDYTASCRVIIYSDEDPSFVLYEALNGDDIYNAIDDTSYANHILTESEAYSIAKAKIKEDACGWFMAESVSAIDYMDFNLESTKKTDEGYIFHVTGTVSGRIQWWSGKEERESYIFDVYAKTYSERCYVTKGIVKYKLNPKEVYSEWDYS